MLTIIGQDIISGNMGYIGTEPGRLYRMGPQSKVAEASGEPPVVLADCKKKPLKGLTIYGKSKQVTTTGAQLLDQTKATVNGWNIKYDIPLEKSKTYTFTNGEKAANSVALFGVNPDEADENLSVKYLSPKESYTFTCAKDYASILLGGSDEKTVTDGEYMLNAGSTPLPYEPYTGGQPSPSPDYPQEIESVGMKWSTGANLLDISQWKPNEKSVYGLALTIENDIVTLRGTYARPSIAAETENQAMFRVISTKTDTQLPDNAKVTAQIIKSDGAKSMRISNDGLKERLPSIIIAFYAINGEEVEIQLKPMIYIGDTAPEWEPYTGGVPKPYGDKIGVGVMGKNLLDPAYAYQNTPSNYRMYKDGFQLKKGVTYTLSCYPSKADGLYIIGVPDYDKLLAVSYKKSFVTYTPNEDVMVTFNYYLDGKLDPKTSKLMLEIGEKPNPSYEPYPEPQSMSIATPNGLPGIPVASGGNYTDADGQKWVCDEIVFGRGVYVQNIKVSKSLNKLRWSTWGVNKMTNGITGFYTYDIDTPKITEAVSNIASYNDDIYGGKKVGIKLSIITPTSSMPYMVVCVRNDTISDISSDNAAIQSFKEMLAETDAYMMYVLATPIETPLTAEQIAAYKQLHTYADSTTIIDNDAGAYMSVKYNT